MNTRVFAVPVPTRGAVARATIPMIQEAVLTGRYIAPEWPVPQVHFL